MWNIFAFPLFFIAIDSNQCNNITLSLLKIPKQARPILSCMNHMTIAAMTAIIALSEPNSKNSPIYKKTRTLRYSYIY
jgi:hypothetical protein